VKKKKILVRRCPKRKRNVDTKERRVDIKSQIAGQCLEVPFQGTGKLRKDRVARKVQERNVHPAGG